MLLGQSVKTFHENLFSSIFSIFYIAVKSLNNYGSTRVPNDTYQVEKAFDLLVLERRVFNFLPDVGVVWPVRFEHIFVFSTPRESIWNGVTIVLWGDVWNHHTVIVLCQKSKNDIALLYAQILIYSLWLL